MEAEFLITRLKKIQFSIIGTKSTFYIVMDQAIKDIKKKR